MTFRQSESKMLCIQLTACFVPQSGETYLLLLLPTQHKEFNDG
jgi:hypothetical protein